MDETSLDSDPKKSSIALLCSREIDCSGSGSSVGMQGCSCTAGTEGYDVCLSQCLGFAAHQMKDRERVALI